MIDLIGLAWTVGTAAISVGVSLWTSVKLTDARLLRAEADIAALQRQHAETEKELVSRLRNIELEVTKLNTLLTLRLDKETH